MVADTKTIVQTSKQYAEDVSRALPVDKVVLFGSYAKGTATAQSDIDLCFFLSSFNGERRVDILKRLFKLAGKYKGIYFEPTAFPSSEIKKGNPFVKEILSSGIEI